MMFVGCLFDDVCGCQLRLTYLFRDLLRRTHGTHVRIDTLNLKKKIWPTPGGLGGYLLLKIFRDGPRPNLAHMCT